MLLVLVVVIFEKTFVFHSNTASSTTAAKSVPFGISWSTLLHACSVEIQEIPTREVISLSEKVNTPPTAVEFDVDETEPLGCSTLLSEFTAVYALLLTASESK